MAVVWHISAVEFANSTLIRGVVLKRSFYSHGKKRSSLSNFVSIGRNYFQPPCKHCRIDIRVNTSDFYPVQTNAYGGFDLEIQDVNIENIEVLTEDHREKIPLMQEYPVIFKNTDSAFDVISDIDDTLLVSHTLSIGRRLGSLFFIPAHRRKFVSFVKGILDYSRHQGGRVFYVSKSESNLFAIIANFIRHYQLPEGDISLTPYLRFRQLFDAKKGSDYKKAAIRKILKQAPEKRFILMGDDTKNDMEVYAAINREFPEQILRVYIRKTLKNLSGKRKNDWAALDAVREKFCYFSDSDDVQKAIMLIDQTLKQQ